MTTRRYDSFLRHDFVKEAINTKGVSTQRFPDSTVCKIKFLKRIETRHLPWGEHRSRFLTKIRKNLVQFGA